MLFPIVARCKNHPRKTHTHTYTRNNLGDFQHQANLGDNCIVSFYFHTKKIHWKQTLSSCPFLQMKKLNLRLSNLPQVTQRVNGKAGINTQEFQLRHSSYHRLHPVTKLTNYSHPLTYSPFLQLLTHVPPAPVFPLPFPLALLVTQGLVLEGRIPSTS